MLASTREQGVKVAGVQVSLLVILSAVLSGVDGLLFGAAYTPYRHFGACPEESQVYEDMGRVMGVTSRVRIYSTECLMVNRILLRYASEGKLEVLMGVWIDNRERDQGEVDDLITALREFPHARITGVVVGNEVMYRNTASSSQLAGRIYEVRHKVNGYKERVKEPQVEVSNKMLWRITVLKGMWGSTHTGFAHCYLSNFMQEPA